MGGSASDTGGTAGRGSSGGGGSASTGGAGGGGAGMRAASGSGPGAGTPLFQSGSRLRARFIEGAPGERQFLGWYDSERKENCAFNLANDGKQHCLPSPTTTDIWYADSKCSTEELFSTSSSTCPTTGMLYGGMRETCGVLHLYALTPTAAPATSYGGISCGKLSSTSDPLTYYTATELSPSLFVAATEE
jgi:hypothetical protein